MKITLKQLSVFCSVYRTQQVSKSARLLHISIPAVSQNIHELERLLNTVLFERTNAGLSPTESARQLWPYANLVIDKVTHIESLFNAEHMGTAGQLRIGANKTYGIYVLSRLLPLFKKMHPGIRVELKVCDNDKIESMVLDHTLDLGFAYNKPTASELDFFACFNDRLCIVGGVNGNYCFSSLQPEDMAAATWILEEETDVRNCSLRYLQERGLPVNDFIVMGTMGAIKRAVATGIGVAVLPYLSIREEMMRGELVEIFQPGENDLQANTIHAMWRSADKTALTEKLLDFCKIRPI